MSVASIHLPPAARPKRSPGRPRRELTPADRATRIKAVALLLSQVMKARAIALGLGISRSTLFAWRSEVLESYTDPAAVELRRMFKDRR